MDEDERPQPKGLVVGGDLSTWSVEELDAYVVSLRREITRVEAELARRRDVRGAAEALFKRPASGSGGD